MSSVTFLITSLGYGGAETQLVRIATKLKTKGWNVKVVSMVKPQAFVDELDSFGVEVASLDMRQGVPNPFAVFKLVSLMRRWKPDILHSHMVHANLLARIARLFCRVPVQISTAHNINEGGRWREIAYRLTEPLCDITTQVSNAGAERYIRVGAVSENKLCVIPNGVDIERFSGNTDSKKKVREELGISNAFVWLAIGRMNKAKDYSNMIRAFSQLVENKPDNILLIVGRGELQPLIEKQVSALGLDRNVRLLGIRKDIPQLMNAADAYIMSSAWEGLPMVLLEASAVGLPIVATDVGGNREVVIDGKSGFLVAPHDSAQLAESLLKLTNLSQPILRKMGETARQHVVEKYSLDHIVSEWEGLYRSFSYGISECSNSEIEECEEKGFKVS